MNESRRNASESRTGAGGRAWGVWKAVGRILFALAAGTSLMALFLVSPEGRALVEAVGYVAPGP